MRTTGEAATIFEAAVFVKRVKMKLWKTSKPTVLAPSYGKKVPESVTLSVEGHLYLTVRSHSSTAKAKKN